MQTFTAAPRLRRC